jgi:hypothetical protein
MGKIKSLINNNKFTIIASLPKNDLELAKAAINGGADILKVHVNLVHRASQNKLPSLKEDEAVIDQILALGVPVGIVLGNSLNDIENELDLALSKNFDFISLYSKDASLKILNQDKLSKVIALDNLSPIENTKLLSEIDEIDVIEYSALDPNKYSQLLSVYDYSILKECLKLSKKPIILPTQNNIRPSDLPLLYKAGLKCLMIGVIVFKDTSESIYNTIKQFKDEINKL